MTEPTDLHDLEIDQTQIMAAVYDALAGAIAKARAKEFHNIFISTDSRGVDLYSPWLAEVARVDLSSLLEGITDDINDAALDGVFDSLDGEDADSGDRLNNFRELRSFATSILKALDNAAAPRS